MIDYRTQNRRIKSIFGDACARCKQRVCPAWCSASSAGLARARAATGVFDRGLNPVGEPLQHVPMRHVEYTINVGALDLVDAGRRIAEGFARLKREGLAPKPPGWHREKYGDHWSFRHVATGISVWPSMASPGMWMHGTADEPNTSKKRGPIGDRDSAMALALGWERVGDGNWQLPGAPNGMCVSMCPDGSWYAIGANARSSSAHRSLPHAIAWCSEAAR